MNDFPFCIQSFVLEMWLVLRMHVLSRGELFKSKKISTCLSVGPARKVLFLSMNKFLIDQASLFGQDNWI